MVHEPAFRSPLRFDFAPLKHGFQRFLTNGHRIFAFICLFNLVLCLSAGLFAPEILTEWSIYPTMAAYLAALIGLRLRRKWGVAVFLGLSIYFLVSHLLIFFTVGGYWSNTFTFIFEQNADLALRLLVLFSTGMSIFSVLWPLGGLVWLSHPLVQTQIKNEWRWS